MLFYPGEQPSRTIIIYLTEPTRWKQQKLLQKLAEKAWKKALKIMVLPTIPLGVQNPGQIDIAFCLHTKPSTQIIIFKDIVEALYKQGIRKLVLMNGHGGNDFKPMIREIQPQFPEMLISLVEWFKILDLSEYFEEEGDHANEMETSVIMHYFPHLVFATWMRHGRR
ncbi:MAG: creatininase family protein [Marinilabiliales bacterium]|nr:creatininase family protein [Marinilabiliales bacterium]